MDENLTTPYNPFGYNLDTGAPDPDLPLMTDEQLINKVYAAFATRISSTATLASADLSLDAGFFNVADFLYDSVMVCSYQSLLVDYTWFNGTIHDVQATPAPNGTISEIWHGSILSSSVSGTSPTLQTVLRQSAVQNSSTEFAQAWADLYSPIVMSTIGGVTSPRANTLQQTRVPVLLVKVLIPALVALGSCCLSYIIAGCVLAILAIRTATRGDVRDAKVRLTLFGLVAWAMALALSPGQEDLGESLPREQHMEAEQDRVGLAHGSEKNFYFKVITPATSRASPSVRPHWI